MNFTGKTAVLLQSHRPFLFTNSKPSAKLSKMLVPGSVSNYLHAVWFPKWGFCWNHNQSKVNNTHKYCLGSTGHAPAAPSCLQENAFFTIKRTHMSLDVFGFNLDVGQQPRRKLASGHKRKLIRNILSITPLCGLSLLPDSLQWWTQEAT